MFTTIVRTAILYVMVIFAMRIMGKRQIGDMQPAELVVTILISEIAAIPIQDASQPIISAVTSIFTLVSLEIALTVITMKSGFMNNITNGKSAIIIKNGVVLQKELKKMRVTVADLVELLRQQGIFDLSEVSYAIFETNGTLSVMQKPFYRNARIGDLESAKPSDSGYPSLVISDGEYIKRGIDDISTTQEHIDELLKKQKISASKVFIMTLDCFDNAVIIKKDENK